MPSGNLHKQLLVAANLSLFLEIQTFDCADYGVAWVGARSVPLLDLPPPAERKPCPDKSLPQTGNLHTGAGDWRGADWAQSLERRSS